MGGDPKVPPHHLEVFVRLRITSRNDWRTLYMQYSEPTSRIPLRAKELCND
jgi:hypothetical protein